MKIKGLTLEELGAVVCETLANHKIDAVLSGGSCVSVWTDNHYSSNDMDMITTTLTSQYQLSAALESIGFTRSGKGRYYVHPDTELALEFPSGPLMLGDEHITEDRIHHLQTRTGTLRLLSPTDCVKDRLAAFHRWGDKQSWEQAVSVARRHTPDWVSLQRWHLVANASRVAFVEPPASTSSKRWTSITRTWQPEIFSGLCPCQSFKDHLTGGWFGDEVMRGEADRVGNAGRLSARDIRQKVL